MEEKLCPDHEDDVLSVCFFEGCNRYFLCQECIKCHPDTHSSKTKNIMSLMRKDDWIKINEEQRDSQMAKLKGWYEEKECLASENQKKLQRMIDDIIECLTNKLSQWIKELNMMDKPETKESFTKLQDILDRLVNINFREGDIYGKVDKAKLFNENIMPESVELCKQVQEAVDKSRIGTSKVDACKQEVLELIQDIHLKDFFNSSNPKRQKDSEQLNLLQHEYENFKQDKIQQIKKLNEDIELLKTTNNDLQAQYDQLIESSNNYEQKTSERFGCLQQEYDQQIKKLNQDIENLRNTNNDLRAQVKSRTEQYDQLTKSNNSYKEKAESLAVANEGLHNEISLLKTELDFVVASKLKLLAELETLKIAPAKPVERSGKSVLLSEVSRIIEDKDLNNIRTWISNPIDSDKQRTCRLALLYRGTRDGFTSGAFESKCKDKNPTMAFIKSKEHGRVFGGYTTKNRKFQNGYIEDKEAFLFSLTHGEKYSIKTPQHAISEYQGYIFTFGQGYDIGISEGCNTQSFTAYSRFPYSYQCSKFEHSESIGAQGYLAGSHRFIVEEIEVYQVIWS